MNLVHTRGFILFWGLWRGMGMGNNLRRSRVQSEGEVCILGREILIAWFSALHFLPVCLLNLAWMRIDLHVRLKISALTDEIINWLWYECVHGIDIYFIFSKILLKYFFELYGIYPQLNPIIISLGSHKEYDDSLLPSYTTGHILAFWIIIVSILKESCIVIFSVTPCPQVRSGSFTCCCFSWTWQVSLRCLLWFLINCGHCRRPAESHSKLIVMLSIMFLALDRFKVGKLRIARMSNKNQTKPSQICLYVFRGC